MKHTKYIPTAIAALALAAVAFPTAAHADTLAATDAVKRPAIQELWNTNGSYTVEQGVGYMHLAETNRLGSASWATGFKKLTVVVTDEQGHQVCSTADNDHQLGGTWDCAFGADVLPVGTHTLRAVATNAEGLASRPSKPVKVVVTADEAVTPGLPEDSTAAPAPGPVDPGFTAGQGDSTSAPAPGPVDPGFTAGTSTEKLDAPQVEAMDSISSTRTIIASVTGTPGAVAHVTDATGKTHEKTIPDSGHVLMNWGIGRYDDGTFDIHLSKDGANSATVHVVPER